MSGTTHGGQTHRREHQGRRHRRRRTFYGGLLGMNVAMDLGWIVTFVADASMNPQVSIAREGGSGAPLPDLSIEVDNFDEVYAGVTQGGLAIEYGPVSEPWGVRRFFVRDPFGRLVNIVRHE
jgi:catechol 2,3-dioxygenase-like lactoylglutathione lyase family enzyme